jgi:hypothetical protein
MKLIIKFLDKKNITHTVSADGFITIDGTLDLRGTDIEDISNVEAIGGSVYVSAGAKLDAAALTSIGGSVYVSAGAKLDAAALTSIGGYVYVREKATFDAAALTSIGGYVYVSAGAKLDAAALTSIGGSVDVREKATFDAAALTDTGEIIFNGKMFGQTFKRFDGIGAIVISEKKKGEITITFCRKSNMVKGKFLGEKFYVASNGKQNAHGKTILLATQELAFKTGNRDISQFKNIKMTTVKTPDEWAFIYRMVTGACQYGVQQFMGRHTLKEKYTLSEIIKMTTGAYGGDRFATFMKGEK